MDFPTQWKTLQGRSDFQSRGSTKDEWMLWSTPLAPNTLQWLIKYKKRRKKDKHLHWPELAMNYKVVSGFEATQVCYVPSLQAHSGSSNFGFRHVMGTNSASGIIVEES